MNKPIWIVSLDLSKAFDRINWDALWLSLRDHGISQHLVWAVQCLYSSQDPGGTGCRQFGLQPWFCYQCWGSLRARAESETFHVCSSLCDGELATTGYSFWFWYRFAWWWPKLLDLKFADDILLVASSTHEATVLLLDLLMQDLAATGLLLNAHKTVTLTKEAQPPSQLVLSNGQVIQMECGEHGHRLLGCILGPRHGSFT